MTHLAGSAEVEVLYEINDYEQKRDNDRRVAGSRSQDSETNHIIEKDCQGQFLLAPMRGKQHRLTDCEVQHHHWQGLVN